MRLVKLWFVLLAGWTLISASSGALRAQGIWTTPGDGNQVILLPSPGQGLPNPAQLAVSGLPTDAHPHGIAFSGDDQALVADRNHQRIFIIQLSTASVIATIDTSAIGYSGGGTLAVSPDQGYALACGAGNEEEANSILFSISAPFSANPRIATVALPGKLPGHQTQAIVFASTGQAFVYHTKGISVLNPPYNWISFTIPCDNPRGGAVAISPNGQKLLATTLANLVNVFSAPFAANSTPLVLHFKSSGNLGLDGVAITPDGNYALVCAAWAPKLFSIKSPFATDSPFGILSQWEEIPLPASYTQYPAQGFEDIAISADGQWAVLSGNSPNSQGQSFPAAFLKAPFTAAEATIAPVAVSTSTHTGRGSGAFRFQPPLLESTLTLRAIPSVAGNLITYTINYANTGSQAAANTVLRFSLPDGTTFVSAEGGGNLTGNQVVWQLGTLAAGQNGSVSASFRLNGTAPLETVPYTLEAEGVPPVAGPPIPTVVFYFAHLAINNIWRTTLTYINSSSQPVTCTTSFYGTDGNPLSMPFPDKPGANRTDLLPGGGALHAQTSYETGFPLQTGWAQCVCSAPLKASLLFRSYKDSVPQAEGGISASNRGSTRFATFAEQWTAVALANPFSESSTVNISIKNFEGTLLGTKEVSLPPRNQTAYNLKDLFDLTPFTGFWGSLLLSASKPVVSFSLNAEAVPIFSALPPGED